MTIKKKTIQMAAQMLSEARSDAIHADQKAGLILAALGIGFGAVLGGQLAGNWDSSSLSLSGQWLWWIGVLLAILSVAASTCAVWPRFRSDDRPTHGITYWGHIASLGSFGDLVELLENQDVDTFSRSTHQLWRVSRLVSIKYLFVRLALSLGAAAGSFMGIAAIFFQLPAEP